VVNWPPELLAEAASIARAQGLPPPCAAQLPYNLISRSFVEGAEESAAVEEAAVSVVASAVLASGVLSGKYAKPDASGRAAGTLDEPFARKAVAAAGALAELADRFDTTPAALAIAFAIAGPRVASVLFGATSPAQVLENAKALDVDPSAFPDLGRIGAEI
jgi:aryl-alcohol dehydrogenase-like predicted oxidoreductase